MAAGDRWRLLLAYHVGRAGLPNLPAHLLTPLTTSNDPARQDAARKMRCAADGPGADIRLQNILLEAELPSLPPGADDDRLRIHHALATNYAELGEYRQAIANGQRELHHRTQIQGPYHPDTLITRANMANWAGRGQRRPGGHRRHLAARRRRGDNSVVGTVRERLRVRR